MSNAWTGVGTKLRRGNADGPPETFADIPEVLTIGGPSTTKGDIEVTNLDSSAKEFIADLQDNGTLDVSINFLPNDPTHISLRQDAETQGSGGNWQIEWQATNAAGDGVEAVTVEFFGEINSFTTNTESGSQTTTDFSIKISGALTWTGGEQP